MMPALKISHYNGDMRGNEVVVYSALSRDACQQRIALAEARGSSEIVGHALSSQIDVVDDGDRFELRHKFEPAVFIGAVSPSDRGSVISGQIEVPAQHFFRFAIGLVTFIALLVLGTSVYDLAFGAHRLLTRSPTELGPGRPATLTQHFAIFLLVPLVVIPIITILWPKARAVSPEVRQSLAEFAQKLLEAKECGSKRDY